MPLKGTLAVSVADDAVAFAFSAENTGSDQVDIEFRSGKTADVAVFEDGEEVWRWSDERMFTQAIETETIDPGGSFTRKMIWDDPQPGQYTAEASLAATNVFIEERIAFEVP